MQCAYGQKFAHLQTSGSQETELRQLRDRTLRHVKEALRLDSSLRSQARSFWDPPDPDAPGADDDLHVFRNDPEFEQLLGRA